MLEEIKKAVEQTLKINLDTVSRRRDLVEGRIIFSVLVLSTEKITLAALGDYINKDHTSIIHYKKEAVNLTKYNKNFRQKFKNCLQKLGKNNEKIEQILTLDFLKKVTKKKV